MPLKWQHEKVLTRSANFLIRNVLIKNVNLPTKSVPIKKSRSKKSLYQLNREELIKELFAVDKKIKQIKFPSGMGLGGLAYDTRELLAEKKNGKYVYSNEFIRKRIKETNSNLREYKREFGVYQ